MLRMVLGFKFSSLLLTWQRWIIVYRYWMSTLPYEQEKSEYEFFYLMYRLVYHILDTTWKDLAYHRWNAYPKLTIPDLDVFNYRWTIEAMVANLNTQPRQKLFPTKKQKQIGKLFDELPLIKRSQITFSSRLQKEWRKLSLIWWSCFSSPFEMVSHLKMKKLRSFIFKKVRCYNYI